MSYTIIKKARTPKPIRQIVLPAREQIATPKKYYIKSNNTPKTAYRYVDDSDDYDPPVIVTPRQTPKYRIINRNKSMNNLVIEDEEDSDEFIDEAETYYYIDGKYYKPAPSNNTVYMKPQPQPVYYVQSPKPQPKIVYVNQDRY